MEIIRYSVIGALPIVALFVCKRYGYFIDSSIERVEVFLSFLRHAERKISGYLTPPSELCNGFLHPALRDMMEKLSSGMSLIDAYQEAGGSVPQWANEILTELFLDFGKGDALLEARRIGDAAVRLEGILSKERENGERQKKVCSAVAPALAIGIVILLI